MGNRTIIVIVLVSAAVLCICCAAGGAVWLFYLQRAVEEFFVTMGVTQRCAFAFEDVNGDGYYYSSGGDRYIFDIPGATVELIDSSGQVVSRSGLRECAVSSLVLTNSSTTATVRLMLPAGYVATSPLEQSVYVADPYMPAAFGVRPVP